MSWVITKIMACAGSVSSAPCDDADGRIITYPSQDAAKAVVAKLMASPPPATIFAAVPVSRLSQAAQSRIAAYGDRK
jgi:hypothetical protein